jgi:hypothetical protein
LAQSIAEWKVRFAICIASVAIQAFTKLLFSFSDVLKTTNCTFQEVDNIFCLAVGIAVYDHHDSFGKLKVTIIDHNPKWDDKSRQEREIFWIRKLKTLSPNGINVHKRMEILHIN